MGATVMMINLYNLVSAEFNCIIIEIERRLLLEHYRCVLLPTLVI